MNVLRNLKIFINLINMTYTVFSIEYSIRALKETFQMGIFSYKSDLNEILISHLTDF